MYRYKYLKYKTKYEEAKKLYDKQKMAENTEEQKISNNEVPPVDNLNQQQSSTTD